MPTFTPPHGFDPDEVAAPPLFERDWPLAAVALDVAGTCNLACRYCAEAATQPRRRRMSGEGLEAAWRLLAPEGRPRAGTSVRLGSGEPLLALPLLVELARRIEAAGGSAAEGRPAVFLTTNGTLAGPEVRDWLVASGWHVKVSLDGPPQVHDRFRVSRRGGGTWKRVAEVVGDLARRMPERLSATAVLCRGTDPEEVFAAIAELGVRRIELVPVAHRDPELLPRRADVARYLRFVRGYARRLAGSEELPVLVRFETRVRRALGFDVSRLPCAAGRTLLAVAPDGALYPCFRFVGVAAYRLGSLAGGIEPGRAAEFRRGPGRPYDRRETCGACWAAPLCGGPCFAVAELLGAEERPGEGRPLPVHCAYVRADARVAVRLVSELRRRDPERLLAFLPEVRDEIDRWVGEEE